MDSVYMKGFNREACKHFRGIVQGVSEDKLMSMKQAPSAEGVCMSGDELTAGFGYACIGMTPRPLSSAGSCLGIIPSTEDGKFWALFRTVAGTYDLGYVDLRTLAYTSVETSTDTLSCAPISSCIMNGVVVMSGYNAIRKLKRGAYTDVHCNLVQLPPAPIFDSYGSAATFAAGVRKYRFTFIDSNLNETGSNNELSVDNTGNENKIINITGSLSLYSGTTNGWAKVRIYRTKAAGSTFYYVGEVTMAATIAYADNTPDASLDLPGNYSLDNTDSVAAGMIADYVFAWDNRVFALGTWESGVHYASRVRWCSLTDSSGASAGNVTSWPRLNYSDLDPDDGEEIIGGYPQFGGRAHVWKGSSAYLGIATGNTATDSAAYKFERYNSKHGFYHNTVVDTGAGLIGRTRNGVYMYNGSTYTMLSSDIPETFANTTDYKMDAAFYDTKDKRYYLSVFDSSISKVVASETVRYRNNVLVYDAVEKHWEEHPLTFLQSFASISDDYERKRVFAGGVRSDVNIITKSSAFVGTSITAWSSRGSGGNPALSYGGFTGGLFSSISARPVEHIATTDQYKSKIRFLDSCDVAEATISAGNLTIGAGETGQYPPDPGVGYVLFAYNNAYGSGPSSSNVITDDGENPTMADGFSAGAIVVDGLVPTDIPIEVTRSSETTLSCASGTYATARGYLIMPIQTGSGWSYRGVWRRWDSPIFGVADAYRAKLWRFLDVKASGFCTLLFNVYVDGVYVEQRTLVLATATPKTYTISLGGSVGSRAQVKVYCRKGIDTFSISEVGFWHRPMGPLRVAQ